MFCFTSYLSLSSLFFRDGCTEPVKLAPVTRVSKYGHWTCPVNNKAIKNGHTYTTLTMVNLFFFYSRFSFKTDANVYTISKVNCCTHWHIIIINILLYLRLSFPIPPKAKECCLFKLSKKVRHSHESGT